MDTAPFFSVIVPTYNRPDFLKRAVASILDQEFTDFELIVVNDGSVKGMEAYREIEAAHAGDVRIRFVGKANAGPPAARNTGISLSRGRFVCFLDDDDIYLRNHLEVLHKLIVKNNYAAAMYRTFAFIQFPDREEPVKQDVADRNESDPLKHIHSVFIAPLSVAIERDVLVKRLFNEQLKIAEDYDLWVRVLTDHPLYIADAYTGIYHITQNSVSSGSVKNWLEHIATYDVIFSNKKLDAVFDRAFRSRWYMKYYNWIITDYVKKSDLAGYRALKQKIIKRVGAVYYLKNRVRFMPFARKLHQLMQLSKLNRKSN